MIYIHLDRFTGGNSLIVNVFDILRACGHEMFEKDGMEHWIPDYPIEAIEKDCDDKFVVLGYDEERKKYTSTFQMYLDDDRNLYIRKVATHPDYQGLGIGKKNLEYVFGFAKKLGCEKVCLDVYDKSKAAIDFYLHNGFRITGKKATRRFEVVLMEKSMAE